MPTLRPFAEHPQRQQLNDELHSRPSADLDGHRLCTHLALLTGENGNARERAGLAELAARFGASMPERFGNHLTLHLGAIRLVWERHTEFSTYTFFEEIEAPDGDLADLFDEPPLARMPADWKEGLEGDLLVAIHLLLLDRPVAEIEPHLPAIFGGHKVVGSAVAGGNAAWTDFQLHGDGASRIVVARESLTPGRTGRLVNRLFEIETYRMMALLAFPLAREVTPEIATMEAELARIAAETERIEGLADEQRQLQELTRIAAQVESLTARTDYRFSASRAYYELVGRRIGELDEHKLAGLQQLSTFLDRRLAPAMRTCEAVATRLNTLSEHIGRASSLLRTRVEIAVQEQNQTLLSSMERRVRLQVRLQETVEGLSAVAISYYLLGIINYGLKSAKSLGAPLDPALITGLLAPLVVIFAYLGVRSLRKRLTHKD